MAWDRDASGRKYTDMTTAEWEIQLCQEYSTPTHTAEVVILGTRARFPWWLLLLELALTINPAAKVRALVRVDDEVQAWSTRMWLSPHKLLHTVPVSQVRIGKHVWGRWWGRKGQIVHYGKQRIYVDLMWAELAQELTRPPKPPGSQFQNEPQI